MSSITTCPNCGVVLNKDMLNFPPLKGIVIDNIYEHPEELYTYIYGGYVPLAECPVCRKRVIAK